jgi:hypothetical protein
MTTPQEQDRVRAKPTAPPTESEVAVPVDAEVIADGVYFDPVANVDPTHVEPVGTTLGEPAKEHWDTKIPPRSTT